MIRSTTPTSGMLGWPRHWTVGGASKVPLNPFSASQRAHPVSQHCSCPISGQRVCCQWRRLYDIDEVSRVQSRDRVQSTTTHQTVLSVYTVVDSAVIASLRLQSDLVSDSRRCRVEYGHSPDKCAAPRLCVCVCRYHGDRRCVSWYMMTNTI